MTKKEQPFQLIDATVLGIKKPVVVFESNRNQILAMDTQVELMKLDIREEDDDSFSIINRYKDAIIKEISFLKNILKLTSAQADAVYDLTQEETLDLVMQVINKMMHIEYVEDTEEPASTEPKDDAKEKE